MPKRFTERARHVMALAGKEARMLSANLIGTEHILLGLISEGEGVAAEALKSIDITGEMVRSSIKTAPVASESPKQVAPFIVTDGPGEDDTVFDFGTPEVLREQLVASGEAPFTPRANTVLALASEEAQTLGDSDVDPEHILLALLREGEGRGAQVLVRLGNDPVAIRQHVLDLLEESRTEQGRVVTVARNVIQDAREGRLNPVRGRDDELNRVMQILCRRRRVGLALTGSSEANLISIIEGLAECVLLNEVPPLLAGVGVYVLDADDLTDGGSTRDLGGAIREAVASTVENSVVALTGLAAYLSEHPSHAPSLSQLITKPLDDGGVRLVLLITTGDYREFIEADTRLAHLFESVEVTEPSLMLAQEMLKGARERYEAHHRLTITDSAIHAAVVLATRYSADGFLPGTAMDLLDEACALTQTRHLKPPPEVRDMDNRIAAIRRRKEAEIDANNFETAAELRDDEKRLIKTRSDLERQWRSREQSRITKVDDGLIVEVVVQRSGRPEAEVRRTLEERNYEDEPSESEATAAFRLLNDIPLGPQDQDLLGTKSAATDISSLLAGAPTPFVFAIDASWGMGKSSLLRQLEELIPSDKGTTATHFNAWTAQGDHALEALIRSVLYTLDPSTVRRAVKRIAKHRGVVRLTRIAFALFGRFFGISRLIDELWDQLGGDAESRNQLRTEIHAMLADWVATSGRGGDRRLVVFVDDVDRCSDAAIVQVCEAIKLYLDAPGLVFVLACDMSVVARGVGDAARGGEGEGRTYLEKIVQVAYRLPPPTDEAVRQLVRGYAAKSGTLHLMDEPIMDILVARCEGNPRRVKRIINSFVLENRLDDAWGHFPLQRVQLIRMIVLRHLYTNLFEWIVRDNSDDPVGDFLQYVSFRRRASDPVGRSERWWADTARLFRHHGLAAPTPRNTQAQISESATALDRVLPPCFPELVGDVALVSLLEGLGDTRSRSAVRAHLLSRPLQASMA